jgi:hypothetical protein
LQLNSMKVPKAGVWRLIVQAAVCAPAHATPSARWSSDFSSHHSEELQRRVVGQFAACGAGWYPAQPAPQGKLTHYPNAGGYQGLHILRSSPALFSAPACAARSSMRVVLQQQPQSKPAAITNAVSCHRLPRLEIYPNTTYRWSSRQLPGVRE